MYRLRKHDLVRCGGPWTDLFGLPQLHGEPPDGETEMKPIYLPGCSNRTWENFIGIALIPE